MSEFYFTITGGRTGTAWLAELVRLNSVIPAVHERLDIDDFGVHMPDIKIMRSFNERGFNSDVEAFWKRKFTQLIGLDKYCETNHTLAKCGLVEYAATLSSQHNFTFFMIRRNPVNQCLSYIARGDFINITIDWQWYLSHSYRYLIVNPKPFLNFGQIGYALWYTYEIEARQAYYRRIYQDKCTFIDIPFEALITQQGAKQLMAKMGVKQDIIMPQPQNAGLSKVPDVFVKKVERAVATFSFDAAQVVQEFLDRGKRLGIPHG